MLIKLECGDDVRKLLIIGGLAEHLKYAISDEVSYTLTDAEITKILEGQTPLAISTDGGGTYTITQLPLPECLEHEYKIEAIDFSVASTTVFSGGVTLEDTHYYFDLRSFVFSELFSICDCGMFYQDVSCFTKWLENPNLDENDPSVTGEDLVVRSYLIALGVLNWDRKNKGLKLSHLGILAKEVLACI